MDESYEEEFSVCGLSPYDLDIYTNLVFELDRGNSIEEELRELIEKEYGRNLKEIDLYFRGHLEGCYPCNQTHNEELKFKRFLDDPLKSKDFWIAGGMSDFRIRSCSELGKRLKRFGLEHLELEDDAQKLKQYILEKYRPEKQTPKSNEEYEDHIRNCVQCQNLEFLARCSWDESFNPFEDAGEKE